MLSRSRPQARLLSAVAACPAVGVGDGGRHRQEQADPRRGRDHEDVVAQCAHLVGRRGAAELGEPLRLVRELGARQRVARIALRLVDAPGEHAPVGRFDLDLADPALRIGGLDLGVVHHRHAVAERDHARVAEVMLELRQPGAAEASRSSPAPCPSRTWPGAPSPDRSPGRARRSRPGAPARSRARSSSGARSWPVTTCSSASAAGCVCRHDAWNLNDVSASAQRSPRRSVRRAGSASLDMPAAMPCAPSRMRFAPVKPSCARYAAISPSAAAFAVCSCFESAASRRNSHRPAACVPAEPKACSIAVGSVEQAADRRRGRQRAGRARWCGRPCSASGRGTRRRGCRPRSRRPRRSAGRGPRPERLRDGQRRRKHDGAGMKHRAVVHVVLLGDVRRGGVDHRREQRAGAPARDQHLGRAVGRPHLPGEALDRLDGARALARQRRGRPVEQQVLGAAHAPAPECPRRRSAAAKARAAVAPGSGIASHRRARAAVDHARERQNDRGSPSTCSAT